MKRTGLLGWVGLIAVGLALTVDFAWAAQSATVRGPERAFVRRGPGTEFQAFATVDDGEQVQVEEVTGNWALVRTASDQSGYVHATFLFYPDGVAVIAATPTAGSAAAGATPRSGAEAAPSGDEPVDLAQRNAELESELEALRGQVASLRGDPSAIPSPGEDLVSLRAEVRRLADVTDALRSRLDAPSPGSWPVPLAADDQWATSTVTVLAGCALLFGWVIGSVLARREERGRRNRIRF
jgi:hypothetical protein